MPFTKYCRIHLFAFPEIIIGYYIVDCTIPKYIWTSAQTTTILAVRRVQYGKVIWARVQIYFGIVQSTVKLPFYYISNCLKKMPLLNYILFLLSYHVKNKTLYTFDF